MAEVYTKLDVHQVILDLAVVVIRVNTRPMREAADEIRCVLEKYIQLRDIIKVYVPYPMHFESLSVLMKAATDS